MKRVETGESLTITRPDDWHLHLRDDPHLADILPHTAQVFGRAMIMPNLNPPVETVTQAIAYRDRILKHLPTGSHFSPLMTLYLTPSTSADEVEKASRHPFVYGCKLYPAGVTTNSAHGITDIASLTPVFRVMEQTRMPLLIHGEVNDPEVDVFDRERVFIQRVLAPLLHQFPDLRVVLEHITTQDAVQFVSTLGGNVAATITAHHLLANRNQLLANHLKPHYYCLPILKRKKHQQALIGAATGGNPKFFLGTDSAPHPEHHKLSSLGCAGVYTGKHAICLYAEAFAAVDMLSQLEGFASQYGPQFYGISANQTKIRLLKRRQIIDDRLPFGPDHLVPFWAGQELSWMIEELL